jgi:hypothetical protein
MAPTADPAFVAAMEDVLEVYRRPYDPAYPVVCMDEANKQLIENTYALVAVKPGQPNKVDHEYKRHGVRNFFLATEPLANWRMVSVTERRTCQDWAQFIRELADGRYQDATKIVLVMDNLNTHTAAALYATFLPDEARRIWERLEVHYTPKHGSWLDMAEIELSVLTRQCLNRRIAEASVLEKEVAAWVDDRNSKQATINWQFTTDKARIKLRRLYPSLES